MKSPLAHVSCSYICCYRPTLVRIRSAAGSFFSCFQFFLSPKMIKRTILHMYVVWFVIHMYASLEKKGSAMKKVFPGTGSYFHSTARHTIGQITKKCKETSDLMWLSLLWFILILLVWSNLFCTIANLRIKFVTET